VKPSDGGKTKHVGSLKAHIEGLLRRSGPSFLIRLGGTGLIADWQDGSNYGELNPKVWSDIDDIDEITSLPDDYLHRNMDKIVQAAAAEHGDKLKCAIICPPGIYGPGRGMVRKQSLFIPEMGREILKLGAPYYTKSGENRRAWVHIDDLMDLYMAVIESAVAGGGNAVWGREVRSLAMPKNHTQRD
jgi:nucleoside-diphosphate-sugar epimerase